MTLYEFGLYDKTFVFNDWLDSEVGLAYTELTIELLDDLIKNSPVIFVRHIFKVDKAIEPDEVVPKILNICYEKLTIEKSFSIQLRKCKALDLETYDFSDLISSELIKRNYILNVKDGEQIISIYMHTNNIYIGIDNVKNNLSKWKGGMPHYSHSVDYDFISRAEYKLIEALECMNIDLSEMKSGLDLGAAPGGWTKVLVNNNIKVICVDPNKLEKKLQIDRNITYYPMTAEQYLRINTNNKFDIIVNDMKMDITKSINIIMKFYNKLNDKGIVVMTFKLPHQFSYKNILNNLKLFRGFVLIGARQFYHNRSEITVILKKYN